MTYLPYRPPVPSRKRFIGTLTPFTYQNTAEGGSDETAVTTGNSGGASGDAFNLILNSVEFESERPMIGTLAYHTLDADAGISWNIPAGNTRVYERWYVVLPSTPVAGGGVYNDHNANGGGTCGLINIDGTGRTIGIFQTGYAHVIDGTTVLAQDTLYRIESMLLSHASAGIIEVKLFLGHSTTPLEVLTQTGLNTNGNTIISQHWRQNEALSKTVYLDDLGLTNVAYLGPTGVDTTPSLAFPRKDRRVLVAL